MADPCDDNPQLVSTLNQAYSDKFVLTMKLPLILQKRSSTDATLKTEYLQMGVHGTIVPASSVPAVETRFGGQSAHFSSHSRPAYSPLTLNFNVDGGYRNYYILWRWLDVLNTAKGSVYDGTPKKLQTKTDLLESGTNNEYQTDLSISSLDEYNRPIIEFIYYNAFITNLGGINYSYRTQDPIECTVEFHFGQLDMQKLP